MWFASDFFMASPREVKKLDIPVSPTKRLTGFQAGMVEQMKLTELLFCIDGSRPEENYDSLTEIRTDQTSGSCVIEVPPAICEGLRNTTPKQIEEYACAWAETSGWISDDGSPEVTIPIVAGLARLSKLAKEHEKRVYMWTCI
jgi:hypothetical protein